eukprot:CAMPEP_0172305306 /NCGR_PEP_ID=MMETSP1058-20130122/6625_1 /TAXON_ID=83371 /ORGANISM="Detonula confervacea, Strain CCMP 353" /LENGTH=505 /DNA_ID=CAMNT_0013016859 /DNA_START=41 /DNA_END=1558 /DNA_ORIENTATION=-
MINYNDGYFNFTSLFQVYGSAAYKATVFASMSSAVYLMMIWYTGFEEGAVQEYNLLEHPYPITVICTAFMFVLSAKVNFCYNRYWEACTALHSMHSKWLDVGSTMAAFHMQSNVYEKVKPVSFGDHQHLNDLILQRNREKDGETKVETEKITSEETNEAKNGTPNLNFGSFLRKRRKNKETDKTVESVSINASSPREELPFPEYKNSFLKKAALKGVGSPLTQTARTERCSSMSIDEGRPAVPSLFLQEGAHLVSLLSAVALSGLRCDSEYAEAPLTKFIPGHHWPNYNSDNDRDMKQYGYQRNGFLTTIKYMLDISRTKHERLAYNAARPFPVIGGLSDREAFLLQRARGTCAKTALAFMWLNEFIIREQMHGSLGSVAPPIVSRLQQYSSDGHLWYNAARKMSYIPFPFVLTQMATLFIIASVFLMPTLMLSKAQVWFGFALNFLTVLLFAGLNEISKELEFPFRSMPNDLPLNLFQAQFNEALVTMFSGFHPDAWWEIEGDA